MAGLRTRRLAADKPAVLTVPVETVARDFTAITFEYVIDATPMLRFSDATGKMLRVGLTPDADKLWRRMNGRR